MSNASKPGARATSGRWAERAPESVDELRRAERAERPAPLTAADARAAGLRIELREQPSPAGTTRYRAYRFEDATDLARPGVVFFHGGSYVAGDEARHERFCAALARESGAVVVSCSYRLGPEHKFPAAIEDAYFATSFVHEHADEFGIDHRKLAIGGIEAGAALAGTVARLAKERRNPALILQLLIGPLLDLRDFATPSHQEFADSAELSKELVRWASEQFLRGEEDRSDPRCTSLLAKNLIGLPPVVLISAERDVLRDDAELFAERLRQAQVSLRARRYSGAAHGFWDDPSSEQGSSVVRECAEALGARG